MAKKKYYAVRKGNKTGIFTSWDECKESVNGYSGAEYKGFSTKEDAKAYLGYKDDCRAIHVNEEKVDGILDKESSEAIAYVDGSYNKEKKIYGSGVVFIGNGIEKLSISGHDDVMLKMWNVAGEVTAAMIAIQKAIDDGYKKLTIYHDYTGIAGWANGWRASEEGAKRYKEFVNKKKEEIELVFEKVSAHTGVFYNEEADKLAKTACGI